MKIFVEYKEVTDVAAHRTLDYCESETWMRVFSDWVDFDYEDLEDNVLMRMKLIKAMPQVLLDTSDHSIKCTLKGVSAGYRFYNAVYWLVKDKVGV